MESKLRLLESLINSGALAEAERIYLELEAEAKLDHQLIPSICPHYYKLVGLRFRLVSSRAMIPWLILSCGLIACLGWIGMLRDLQLGFQIWLGLWIALMIHEFCHLISAQLIFGIRSLALSGIMLGWVPDLERELRAGFGARMLVFSSGSLANLVIGIWLGIHTVLGLVNLLVGIGNLIPMGRGLRMSDGLQILRELKLLARKHRSSI